MASKPWRKQLRLHESTQRGLCRLVFLCLAFLPMVAISGYSLVRMTPWYQSYQKDFWQRRISDNLGVDVRFASIEFPSPDHFRAHDLVCFHPETGREIMRVSHILGAMDRTGWTVELDAPELNGQQLQSALQVVHDWFLCRPQKSATLLALKVPELMVYDGLKTTKFQNVEVGLKPTETTSTLVLNFSLDGQKFSKRANLLVEREHALEPPTTNWILRTNDIVIPCELFGQRFPMAQYLGERAEFRGNLKWNQSEHLWSSEMVDGEFTSVDLGALTTALGTPLRGMANLKINQAKVVNGSLIQMDGTLDAHRGSATIVDVAWLKQSIRALSLLSHEEIFKIPDGDATASSVSIAFGINENGLSILGTSEHTGIQQRIALTIGNLMVAGSKFPVVPLDQVRSWLQPNQDVNNSLTTFLNNTLPWQRRRIASRP